MINYENYIINLQTQPKVAVVIVGTGRWGHHTTHIMIEIGIHYIQDRMCTMCHLKVARKTLISGKNGI